MVMALYAVVPDTGSTLQWAECGCRCGRSDDRADAGAAAGASHPGLEPTAALSQAVLRHLARLLPRDGAWAASGEAGREAGGEHCWGRHTVERESDFTRPRRLDLARLGPAQPAREHRQQLDGDVGVLA